MSKIVAYTLQLSGGIVFHAKKSFNVFPCKSLHYKLDTVKYREYTTSFPGLFSCKLGKALGTRLENTNMVCLLHVHTDRVNTTFIMHYPGAV